MPPKIKQLVAELLKAGFARIDGGKGSHRKYKHSSGIQALLSGKDGNDAKPYMIKQIKALIEEAKSKGK